MPVASIDSVTSYGFIAFAAHNSVGSTVYVYDNISGSGVVEVRENDELAGGITATSAVANLFCYAYDPSDKAAPIRKRADTTKFSPAPKDLYPVRMLVTVAAE